MKKETNLTLGVSDPELVDAYMKKLKHPKADLAAYLRVLILSAHRSIGEGIYWNAPTFYYTGNMKPFDPKTYKRYIVGLNFFKQDAIRLVFLRGILATDKGGLLAGNYQDGRRIMTIDSFDFIRNNEASFKMIIRDIIDNIDS